VLLQFHVKGRFDRLQNKIAFEGEVNSSRFCTNGYPAQLQSKPLRKNLSLVCDQAYWMTGERHKYEVRLTNGLAARQIAEATITLEVHYFDKNNIPQRELASFVVTMEKTAPTSPPETTSSDHALTSALTEAATTKVKEFTTQESEKLTILASEGITTLGGQPTPISSQDISSSTVSTSAAPTPQGTFFDIVTSSKQNIATLAAGMALFAVIIVESAVIAGLVYRSRRRNRIEDFSDADSAGIAALKLDDDKNRDPS